MRGCFSIVGGQANAFAPAQVFGTMHQKSGQIRNSDAMCSTKDNMYGVSGSLGINIYDVASVSVNGGVNWGDEEATWQIQDQNGDGIPDGLASDGTLDLGAPMSVNQSYTPGDGGNIGDLRHTNRSSLILGGGASIGGAASVGVSHTWGEVSDDKVFADLNGDGFTDLVYVSGGSLWYRLGKWDGTLGALQSHPTPDIRARAKITDRISLIAA